MCVNFQVCRIAYELMQTMHADATDRFHSLDDHYYFGGQDARKQTAIYPHQSRFGRGEIDLQIGDVIELAGNHWNGYSQGRNQRTGQMGLYPTYKAREQWRIVKMPTYAEAANVSLSQITS